MSERVTMPAFEELIRRRNLTVQPHVPAEVTEAAAAESAESEFALPTPVFDTLKRRLAETSRSQPVVAPEPPESTETTDGPPVEPSIEPALTADAAPVSTPSSPAEPTPPSSPVAPDPVLPSVIRALDRINMSPEPSARPSVWSRLKSRFRTSEPVSSDPKVAAVERRYRQRRNREIRGIILASAGALTNLVPAELTTVLQLLRGVLGTVHSGLVGKETGEQIALARYTAEVQAQTQALLNEFSESEITDEVRERVKAQLALEVGLIRAQERLKHFGQITGLDEAEETESTPVMSLGALARSAGQSLGRLADRLSPRRLWQERTEIGSGVATALGNLGGLARRLIKEPSLWKAAGKTGVYIGVPLIASFLGPAALAIAYGGVMVGRGVELGIRLKHLKQEAAASTEYTSFSNYLSRNSYNQPNKNLASLVILSLIHI